MHDLVIRNGRVVDGTGSAPRVADVAIDGDRVTPGASLHVRVLPAALAVRVPASGPPHAS